MSCYTHEIFIFTLFFSSSILALVLSSPVPKISPYDNFIEFLTNNNCTMPKEVKLPFPNVSDPLSFNYLSLKECRSSALKEYDEANMLCNEIFDVLKNITCEKYKEPLPLIESEHFSENVCPDFESLKDIIPKRDNYLSGRLSDDLICKVLCSAEKFEPLCTTLLWSYSTLLKIQNVLSSEAQIQGNSNQDKETSSDKDAVSNEAQIQTNLNESINEVSPENVIPAKKSSSLNVEPEQDSQNMRKTDKSKVDDILQQNKETPSNPNQTGNDIHRSKVSDDLKEVSSQAKKFSLNPQKPEETINQTTSSTKSLSTTSLLNKTQPENQKSTLEDSESTKPIDSKSLSKVSSLPEHQDNDENKINVGEKLSKGVVNDNIPKASSSENNVISNVNGIKDVKNETINNGNDKDTIDNNNIESKAKEKSAEPIAPSTENNDNEVKNNFPDENKSNSKQIDTENKEIKETEKEKQTDYEGPNEVLPDNESKLPESSTQLAIPDEDIEHQEDKDQDQYNDIENEGDYAKPEYDNSFNLPTKNKGPEVKKPIPVNSNQLPNSYDSNMNARNNIGRISEEIAMIAPFPEQEDSHFFFYFLSIVLIIMAGYLIFHNKQKIIALIVEGRHERRRRSHGAGYKKLETK